jgi:hypothetical protein
VSVKLFKLAATTPTISDTTYFLTLSAAISVAVNSHYTIQRSRWITGSGGTAGSGSLTTRPNGYYNLCVNGVLQQSALYTVTTSASKVVLNNPGTAAYTIPRSAPITLALASITTDVVVP